MKWRAITGAVMCLVGALWIGQGSGALGGSVMTGKSQWTVIGAVVAAVGVVLLGWAVAIWRRAADRQQ